VRRRPLIVGGIVSLFCLAGFWELAEDFAYSPAVLRFDTVVSAAVQSWRSPGMTALMKMATLGGGFAVVTAVAVTIFVVLWLRRRRDRKSTRLNSSHRL